MLSSIYIDKKALQHNFRVFRGLLGSGQALAVLKSNAYGHGLEQVYRALEEENPAWLGVNYIKEAECLRNFGYKGRILVVGPCVAEEIQAAVLAQAEPVLGNWQVLDAWLASGPKVCAHIKFDTGMSRQGFRPEHASAVAQHIKHKAQHVAGICTHFANVEDVTDHSYADHQLKLFSHAISEFRAHGLNCLQHAASSASSLILPDAHLDLSRIGISLYGIWPSPATKISTAKLHDPEIQLRPVLSWKTQITTLKPVKANEYIGYGCTYRAIRDMQIAVLPVGYFEGYPRIAGESPSYVLIHGQRSPIVGRICMNMMMVDVTHVEGVKLSDPVTLIGTDGNETLPAQEVASWARSIPYELLARLNPDIPRILTP